MLVCAVVAGFGSGHAAHAASGNTIHVTTTVDDHTTNGNCTLREAIQAANTDHAVDACPAGSHTQPDLVTLPNGHYTIGSTLTVTADVGGLQISGNNNGALIDLHAKQCDLCGRAFYVAALAQVGLR